MGGITRTISVETGFGEPRVVDLAESTIAAYSSTNGSTRRCPFMVVSYGYYNPRNRMFMGSVIRDRTYKEVQVEEV